jgi:hypothetical protein
MKKILLLSFIFAFISCTKVKLQDIPRTTETKAQIVGIQANSANYSEVIDVMVAFLWPLKISGTENQLKLEVIIADSRELVSSKEKYLNKKFELQEKFQNNQCPCALNNECTGAETEMDQAKCYEIEDAIYQNDDSLIYIFGLVENIKKNVKDIGGEWFDTHLDVKNLPNSQVKFSTMDIYFSALGSYEENNTQKPFSYIVKAIPITQELHYKRMTFSMPRLFFENDQTVTHGDWTIDVGLMENKYSLLFQGDLFWNYQDQKRRGVIYWENPRR